MSSLSFPESAWGDIKRWRKPSTPCFIRSSRFSNWLGEASLRRRTASTTMPVVSAAAPVVWGDVVMDRKWGASICSTETVFGAVIEALLERSRTVSEVIWLGETDGIYDQQGSTIPVISPQTVDQVLETLGGAAGTDVTGGMRHRLETAARLANLGISSWIVNGLVPDLLERRLSGEVVPGTQVSPG